MPIFKKLIVFYFLFYFSILNCLIINYTFTQSIFPQKSNFDTLLKGIEEYRRANFKEAIYFLTKFINSEPKQYEKSRAYLYLGFSFIALANEMKFADETNYLNKSKLYIEEALKLDPKIKIDPKITSPKIVEIFNSVKEKISFISDVSLEPRIFYPYKANKPEVKFKLSKEAIISFSIKRQRSFKKIFIIEEFGTIGFNKIVWTWNPESITPDFYFFEIETKTDEKRTFRIQKKVKIAINIPKELMYNNNEFKIIGKKFKDIKISKSKIPWWIPIVLQGGGLISAISGQTRDNLTVRDIGFGMIAVGALFWIFMEGGNRGKVISEENVRYNKLLRKQIEYLKRQISVTQEVEESDES